MNKRIDLLTGVIVLFSVVVISLVFLLIMRQVMVVDYWTGAGLEEQLRWASVWMGGG